MPYNPHSYAVSYVVKLLSVGVKLVDTSLSKFMRPFPLPPVPVSRSVG